MKHLVIGKPFLLMFKPQKIFLFTAIFWGTISVFITPPFQVPDEPAHFFRAYQIASGNFFPVTQNNMVGGIIPLSIIKTVDFFVKIPFHTEQKTDFEKIKKSLALSLNPKVTSFTFFPNTATYAPVLYVPQSFAISIGKCFNTTPLLILYAARIFTLVSWTILIYLAIVLTPVYKYLFTLLALTPMSVFQAASMSPDSLTIGAAFLFIAVIFRLSFNADKGLKKLDLLYLIVLLIFLTLSRYAYCFLYLLFFLIPVRKADSLKHYLLAAMLLLIITCITLLIGGSFVKHIYESIDPSMSFYGNPAKKVQPYLQIQFILTHITCYFKTLFVTFWTYKFFIHSFIGKLGWLDTPLPLTYVLMASFTLIFISVCEFSQYVVISIRQKLIMLTSICSVIVVISLLLYLSWSPVGSSIIEGIQGRYFIPIAPLVFTLLYNRTMILSENNIVIISISYLAISFLVMNFSLISRYYIG